MSEASATVLKSVFLSGDGARITQAHDGRRGDQPGRQRRHIFSGNHRLGVMAGTRLRTLETIDCIRRNRFCSYLYMGMPIGQLDVQTRHEPQRSDEFLDLQQPQLGEYAEKSRPAGKDTGRKTAR